MWDIIKFTIKAIIVIVVIYAVLQFDYNGRKLMTYVSEVFSSYKVRDTVDNVKSKVGVAESKKNTEATRISKTFAGKPKKQITEANDKERKQLEKLME